MAAKTKAPKAKARRPAGRRVPIAELFERDLEYLRRQGASDVTIRLHRRIFGYVKDDLGLRYCDELEDPGIVRRVDEGMIPSRNMQTRRSVLAAFRTILRRGKGWGQVRSVPPFPDLVKWAIAKIPRATPRPIAATPRDVHRLLEHLEQESRGQGVDAWKARRLHALAATVAYAGIGMGQALRLEIADVDLAGSTIWLRGNRSIRRAAEAPPSPIRIDDKLRTILAGWIRRTKCQWAFPGVERRGPWRQTPYWSGAPIEQLRAAVLSAGISKAITFESLRLYFAENAVLSLPARPGPAARPAPPAAEAPAWEPGAGPSVRLLGPGEPVIVRGRFKRPLGEAQRRIIQLLLDVWPEGLSTKGMDLHYGKGAWRQLLIRLRRDPDWAAAVAFPGRGYPGMATGLYRIV